MSTDPTNYHRPIEPTQAAHYNPYEMTSPYREILLPPPHSPIQKTRWHWIISLVVAVIAVSSFAGIIGYVVGNSNASPAFASGYHKGKTTQGNQDAASMQATATASYNDGYMSGEYTGEQSGKTTTLNSLYDFLYNAVTSTGTPCRNAGIVDSQGNSDFRYIRLYKDSSGTLQYECIAS